jgi:hypothetical protein
VKKAKADLDEVKARLLTDDDYVGQKYLFYRAQLCILQGNYEEALARIEAGLALGDETAAQGLAYNEIAVLEYLGRWDEAKAKARAYAAAYPTDKAGILENAFLKTR